MLLEFHSVSSNQIEVEMSLPTRSRAVSVALIRTQAGYDYIAIRRMSRSSKRAAWKSIDKLWIPFAGAAEISGMINIAHNIGCRRTDWIDSKHKLIERTIYKDKQVSIPPIVEPSELSVATKQSDSREFVLKLEGMLEKNLFED